MAKKPACQRIEYKRALKQLTQDLGYSAANRVPKHVRVALRSSAWGLAKVRCSLARTGQPYPERRGKRARKRRSAIKKG